MTATPTTVSETNRGMTGIGVLILFIALVLVAAIASGLILDTAGLLQNTAQDTGEQSMSEVSDRISILSASGDVNGLVVHVESSEYGGYDQQVTVNITNSTGATGTIDAGNPYEVPDGTYNVTVDAVDHDPVSTNVTIEGGGGQQVRLELPYNSGAPNTLSPGDQPAYADPLTRPEVEELGLTVYRSPGSSNIDLEQVTIEYFSPYGTAFLIHENRFEGLTNASKEEFTEDLGTFFVEAVADDEVSVPVLSSRADRALIRVPLYGTPEGTVSPNGVPISSGEPVAMKNLEGGDSATIRLTTQEGATSMYIVNVPESLSGSEGSSVQL